MSDKISCTEVDERLATYVDGQDAGEDAAGIRRSIEAHVAACPSCLQHLQTESMARDVVGQHRAALLEHAPAALHERCSRLRKAMTPASASAPAAIVGPARSPLRRWAPLSIAATLLLAVGGVFVLGMNNRVEALAASLAIDHVKCFKVSGSDHHVNPDGAEVRWQQDQGWPITVPAPEPSEQLRLLDVRRCFSTDGRAAHMLYTWRGAPLSLYVLQGDLGADRVMEKMGREAIIWSANGRTYAVVADGRPPDLDRIAQYLKVRVK